MKRFLKWLGIIFGGIVGLVALLLVVAYVVTGIRGSEVYAIPNDNIASSNDPISIDRGRHLVHAIAKCTDCHGEDFGGKVVVDDPMVGTLAGPNITSGKGSVTQGFTDADLARAIRYGVHRDSTPLIMMPSSEYWYHDDEELSAIISYLRSVPPVDRPSVPSNIGPMIRVMNLFGQMDIFPTALIDHTGKRPPVPAEAATVEYGRHMSTVGGCIGCHGPELSGGPIPGAPPDWPPSGNLTPDMTTGIGKWTEADFFRALRNGVTPAGKPLNAQYMPWKATAQMKNVEISALYLYLKSIPAKPAGNR